jgi:phage/plasmid-associated DNA primase
MRYEYKGGWYTPKELSEMSGIKCHTIRDRLRRGFSVEEALKVQPVKDSVRDFSESSFYEDWIGMAIAEVYEIYWKWCLSNGYSPMHKQGFSRQLFSMYPNLKLVPTQYGDGYYRVIRRR